MPLCLIFQAKFFGDKVPNNVEIALLGDLVIRQKEDVISHLLQRCCAIEIGDYCLFAIVH